VVKEWLKFLCTVAEALIIWSIIYYIASPHMARHFWVSLFNMGGSLTYSQRETIMMIGLIYSVRLTLWSIKGLRKNIGTF